MQNCQVYWRQHLKLFIHVWFIIKKGFHEGEIVFLLFSYIFLVFLSIFIITSKALHAAGQDLYAGKLARKTLIVIT